MKILFASTNCYALTRFSLGSRFGLYPDTPPLSKLAGYSAGRDSLDPGGYIKDNPAGWLAAGQDSCCPHVMRISSLVYALFSCFASSISSFLESFFLLLENIPSLEVIQLSCFLVHFQPEPEPVCSVPLSLDGVAELQGYPSGCPARLADLDSFRSEFDHDAFNNNFHTPQVYWLTAPCAIAISIP